jgi:hypothetical protein
MDVDTCPICDGILNFEETRLIDPKVITARRSTFSLTQKTVNWDFSIIDPPKIRYRNKIVSEPFVSDIAMKFESVNENGELKNYYICNSQNCGEIFSKDAKRKPGNNHVHTVADMKICSTFKTRFIILDLSDYSIDDDVTLLNALIAAATFESGCEDGEISGFVIPEINKFVFFDNVEGGVGFVDVIAERFQDVINTARELCEQTCCENGCVRCIGSFWRQRDLDFLRKKDLLPLIKKIMNDHELN